LSLALFCAGVAAGTCLAKSALLRASLFAGNARGWLLMDDVFCAASFRPWVDALHPYDFNAEAF